MTESKFELNDSFIEDWLTQTRKKSQMIEEKSKATILHTLEILVAGGPVPARERLAPDRTKHLFDDVWEIRVHQYRIAYFWDDEVCVLLYGIRKKTHKWPLKKIEVVKTRRKNYINNK